jgi:hypothetical protein
MNDIMYLLISIFVAFVLLLLILPIGIVVEKVLICAFKSLEKK